MYATLGSEASTSTSLAWTSTMRMFRFESTLTSSPPTVLSNPPRRLLDDDGVDCTMTLTCASPFPDKMSCRRSGEILVVERFAARALVLGDMHRAEQRDSSTAAVTRHLKTWGRDIQFLQGLKIAKAARGKRDS